MIKVLLAEDMHMVRGALVALLDLEPDIEVVAEVVNGSDVVPAAHRTEPDVAILDIDLPGKDGLTAASELHDQLPGVRTLMLTGLSQPGTLRRALSAKVTGFLLKDAPSSQLAGAIRDVAAGRRVVDGHLAMAAWDSAECPLNPRETEVLSLLMEGLQAVDIASRLFLSVGTVRNYLTTIITKLGARNRVDAIRIARESGWV
jgi:two-component system response regulator DesR